MGNKASKKKKNKNANLNENEDEDPKDEFAMNVSSALPSSIDRILAEQHKNEEKTELITAFGGKLSEDQPLIKVDDVETPLILVLLKKYLFQSFNGAKHVGIMNNGVVEIEETENRTTAFVSNGIVSLNDCNLVKQLISSQKITLNKLQLPNYNNNEQHYAMIFAELVKIWLSELSDPLLQPMPSTFFDGLTEVDFLELEIDNIPHPNLAALILLWDICIQIDENHKVNKMKTKMLAAIFAPYLYADKDKERNDQIIAALRVFFEVGIKWRRENQ